MEEKTINENAEAILDCLDTASECVYEDVDTAYDMITSAEDELTELLPKIGVFVWVYDNRDSERYVASFNSREEAERSLKEEVMEACEDIEGGDFRDDGKTVEYSKGYSFRFTWKRYY